MLKFDGDLYVLVPLDALYFLVVGSVVRFLLYQVFHTATLLNVASAAMTGL